MRKNAFTLIELLAVLVILAIIMLITTPVVLTVITDANRSAFEISSNNLVKAIEYECQLEILNEQTISSSYVFLDGVSTPQLETKGNLPTNGEAIVDSSCNVIFSVSNGSFTALKTSLQDNTIILDGDLVLENPVTFTTYANGTAVYFNPETGEACTSAEAVSSPGTKTGCMKWYTFNDLGSSSDIVNLLLDHNTNAMVMWNSTGSNLSGPTNILSTLQSDTSFWNGVITRKDTYNINNGNASYTIGYDTYKARLITAKEIADITGNSTFIDNVAIDDDWFYFDSNTQNQTVSTAGASNYDWLFDYTISCTSYGCNTSSSSTYGYWTATAVSNSVSKVWYVRRNGRLDLDNANISTGYGIRPVITVLKSSI